ncbi:MAG: CsoS2 family carboxysome shell protein [Pseudomonadota bacterium]
MARVETTERSAREAARARRAAQARGGKKELKGSGSASTTGGVVGKGASSGGGEQGGGDARTSARERRRAMAHQGKAALKKTERSRVESRREEPEPAVEEAPAEPSTAEATGPEGESCPPGTSRRRRGGHCEKSSGHLQARARRRALADRGKAAETSGCLSAAQVARQSNPDMSGREIARRARADQARNGARGRSGEDHTSRRRKMIEERRGGGSSDAPWKVGASETSHGQEVTGTQVSADSDMTGWEAGACRGVTGTEYLSADLFRDLCATEPAPAPMRSGVSRTGHGGRVTGNEVGRGERVTGNEPGTCQSVTGTEYLGTEQFQGWCGTTPEPGPGLTGEDTTAGAQRVTGDFPGRSSRVTGDERGVGRSVTGTQYLRRESQGQAPSQVPPKVEQATTLRGGEVTGSRVGRSERVTGDEPGSCRAVTGNDYVGREQYQETCGVEPPRQGPATPVSATGHGLAVSGARSGRNGRVTGNEPGTCQAVTGTPYMGAEEYRSYCAPADQEEAAIRQPRRHSTPASEITGQQPGLNGAMTGADDGACQTPTGTPYVGQQQYTEACAAEPATPASPDFPQSLEGAAAPTPTAEPPAAHAPRRSSAVTGSRYEGGGSITGPFGMAEGKVTGTETARHEGRSGFSYTPDPAPQAQSAQVDRITGEGAGSGPSITGDDWDRGERVTGTEGTAARRNPSRRGQQGSVMPMQREPKRNEDVPLPDSPVTGSSGTTDKGAAVTYSGGARG